MRIEEPTYTCFHYGNAAKAIHLGSTVTGMFCGAVSLMEIGNNQFGTYTQVAAVAIPALVFLGRTLRIAIDKCRGRPVNQYNPIPIPFVLGLSISLGYAGIRSATLPYCDYYKRCPNSQPAFVNECETIQGICHTLLDSPNSWISGRSWSPIDGGDLDLYCYLGSTGAIWDTKSTVIEFACHQLLVPQETIQTNVGCDGYYNPTPEAILQLMDLKNELYNMTNCNPQIDEVFLFKAGTNILFAEFLAAGSILFCAVLHPLNQDKELRQCRVAILDTEADPLLSLIPEQKKNRRFLLLENI